MIRAKNTIIRHKIFDDRSQDGNCGGQERVTQFHLRPNDEMIFEKRGIDGEAAGIECCKAESNWNNQAMRTYQLLNLTYSK